jgi:integrase
MNYNYKFRQLTSRPDSAGRCRVLLDVTWKNVREKLPTGVSCQPANFKATAGLGKTISKKDPDALVLNARLASLVANVSDLFLRATANQQVVTREQVIALARKPEQVVAPAAEAEPDPLDKPIVDYYELWKLEHQNSTPDARRRYQQVVNHLEKFQAGLTLRQFTKPVYHAYQAALYKKELSDSTVSQHVKFLRIAHRLAERHIPSWLALQVKFGRAVSLRADELQALASVELPAQHQYLHRERERLLFQTLLLLRDSDLRQLKPHHVTLQQLPGIGLTPVLEFHQVKTGGEVRLPLPPAAADIWQRWEGKVPVIAQQKRNTYIKELAEAAGLTRTFVRVRFKAGKAVEEPLPLWQAITTHTPRHTGADLVLWGSNGDQNLKEVALGHLAGGSVYGYDTLDRYGPLFLQAWEKVGAR